MASVIGHRPVAATLKALVGEGDRIMARTLPAVIAGLAANMLWPSVFHVGPAGPTLGAWFLAIGVPLWITSAVQVLVYVPKGRLITKGPFAIMRHPLYTSVALLVVPGLGMVFGSWVGFPIGIALYAWSRRFSPNEELELSAQFGRAYDEYRKHVLVPWL